MIEFTIDVIYTLEILLNFLKKTRANKDLKSIGMNYMLGYFAFDAISTIPHFFLKDKLVGKYYILKLFRMVHIDRLTVPNMIILGIVL